MIRELIRKAKKKHKIKNAPDRKYIKYCNTLPLAEKSIFVEASRGSNVDGNMFYCTREILTNPDYKDYRLHLVVKNDGVRDEAILKYGELSDRIEFVKHHTDEYYRMLATCKYLLNDATFGTFFIKREGQALLNTWHGTPLKTMGRRNNSEFDVLGNVQHNLLMADYILQPNLFTEKIMIEDYMLNDISKAKQLRCGYPRNIAFDINKAAETRRTIGVSNKRVYAYLPTWRGKSSNPSDDANRVLAMQLDEIDKLLEDDEIMLAKLHHLSRTEIDFDKFNHIICFPEDKETYEVLNAADALVTDYSSVMFDYAVTRRPIVLFTYDREEYEKDRGLYLKLEDLPFACTEAADELLSALRKQMEEPSAYGDFIEKFCPWDDAESARNVVSQLIFGESKREVLPVASNGKSNIMVYAGSFDSADTATKCEKFFSEIDMTDANYYIAFYSLKSPSGVSALRSLLDNYRELRYIEFRGAENPIEDKSKADLFEFKRLLGSMNFDEYILLETSDEKVEKMLKANYIIPKRII